MEEFLKRLTQISPLNSSELNSLTNAVTVQQLKKGDFWLEEGKKASLLGFIQKGYLRKYYVQDGSEITDFFYLDGSFAGDIPSIVSQKPALTNLIAMEPTTILSIPYKQMENICAQHHTIEHIMRVMITEAFLTFYYRSNALITSSPKERYEKMIIEQPQILQRATQYHIASFLGISPQHLSRLRAE